MNYSPSSYAKKNISITYKARSIDSSSKCIREIHTWSSCNIFYSLKWIIIANYWIISLPALASCTNQLWNIHKLQLISSENYYSSITTASSYSMDFSSYSISLRSNSHTSKHITFKKNWHMYTIRINWCITSKISLICNMKILLLSLMSISDRIWVKLYTVRKTQHRYLAITITNSNLSRISICWFRNRFNISITRSSKILYSHNNPPNWISKITSIYSRIMDISNRSRDFFICNSTINSIW